MTALAFTTSGYTYIEAGDMLNVGPATYTVLEVDELAGRLLVQPSGEDYAESVGIELTERRVAQGAWGWQRQAPLFDLAQFLAA